MEMHSCARGAAYGTCAAGATIAASAVVPAAGAAILSNVGVAGYNVGAIGKAGAIGASMITAPICGAFACALGSIDNCRVEVEVAADGDQDRPGLIACAPIWVTTVIGSLFSPGVSVVSATAATMVGGAAMLAGGVPEVSRVRMMRD